MSTTRTRRKPVAFEDAVEGTVTENRNDFFEKVFDDLGKETAKRTKTSEIAAETSSEPKPTANLPVDVTKIPRHVLAVERELPSDVIEELQLNKILKIENKNEKIFREVINDDIEFILEKHGVSKSKTTVQKVLENLEKRTTRSKKIANKFGFLSISNLKKISLIGMNAFLYYPAIKAVVAGASSHASFLAVVQLTLGIMMFCYNGVWSINIIRNRFPNWASRNSPSWSWEYDEIAKFKPDLSPRLKRRLADIIKSLPTSAEMFNEFLIFYRKKADVYNLTTVKIVGSVNLGKNEKLYYDLLTWDMDVDREIF